MTRVLSDPFGEPGDAIDPTDDERFARALVEVEVALAGAQAAVGAISQTAANAIARAAEGDAVDLRRAIEAARRSGSPVIGIVEALAEAAGAGAGTWVHHGATTQDVVDTANALLLTRAARTIQDELHAARDRTAALADAHRRTLMLGRTLLQPAVPTTFGLRASVWLTLLGDASAQLRHATTAGLAVQLGGAAGTAAALGVDAPRIADELARKLGLPAPIGPWHTNRVGPAAVAGALGIVCGSLAKIARDVTLLASADVCEVREGGGGSSTRPHKRNPVHAIAVIATARRAPGLVATVLASMEAEHERPAGAWHAEWPALAELARLTSAAAFHARVMLTRLSVDAERMRTNLDAAGVEVLSEQAATALAHKIGRRAANAAVEQALAAEPKDLPAFVTRLVEVTGDVVEADSLAASMEPSAGIETAQHLIDRALQRGVDREEEDPR